MYKVRTRIGMIIMSVLLLIGMAPTVANLPVGNADGTAYAAGSNTVEYSVGWHASQDNKINISYTSSNRGWVYYIVRNAGSDAPTLQEVINNNEYFPQTLDSYGRKSGSTAAKVNSTSAKDVYLVFQEAPKSGKVYYDVTKVSLPARSADTTVIGQSTQNGSVSFRASRKDSSNASLTVTPSVAGTLHYIVKGTSDTAPSNEELLAADGISESANVTKTSTVSLGDNSSEAKKIYVLYVSSDGTQIGSGSIDIAAYDTGSYSAEIKPDSLNLGIVTDDYTSDSTSQTATISNTGNGALTFSVDTSADGYDTFSQYFTVDTSGAKNIASGSAGSVTVRPKEGLDPGTYSASFSLIDKVSDDKTLTLGPVKVQMVVVEKGDSMPEGIRPTQGEYTPSSESLGGGSDTSKITIDNKVAYCVNYYFALSNQSGVMGDIYYKKFGKLPNVTAQEMDAYTGLNLNVPAADKIYPPNNNGFTPVKKGDPNSKTLANVRKVLYNGYGTDAAGIRSKYNFKLAIDHLKDYAFEIATQCAIWHYTDTNTKGKPLTFSELKSHIKNVYTTVPSWGWDDIEGIYNILIGEDTSIQLKEPTDDFETDLFIADNPINDVWTQNLVTGSAKAADVSITKVWDDEGDMNGSRPGPSTFKSWLHLYKGTVDVTSMYADNLTVESNGNNTYTAKWSGLPGESDQYSVKEVIPQTYSGVYEALGSSTAKNGGSITNTNSSNALTEIKVTKVWKDDGNALNSRPTTGDFKDWVKLYANGAEKKDATPEISADGDTWTISYKDLPKYDSEHKLINYTVKESIPEGEKYSADYGSGAEAASDNGVISNTLSEKTSLSATKKWENNQGESIDAPENANVTFTLLINGEASDKTVTLDGTADENGESSAWTAEWKDLPKYDENGEKITYSVYESEGQEGFIGDHTSESSALTFEGSSAAITNKKIGGAKVSLGASKVMTGAPLSGGDFSFELSDKDGSVIDTKSNDANGNISFVDIDYTYNDVGDHVYYIKEVPGSDSSIKYDSSIYRVTVSVRADGTNVTAEPKYEKSTDGGQTWSPVTKAIFSNIKGSAAKWNLVAKKVTSDNSKFEAGEFLFGIFDESGHQYYLTSEGTLTLEKNGNTAMTATNDASGNIVFPEVTAASESETSYYIKEIGCASDDSADKWICDTISAHKADVRVYKDSDGNFKAEVKYAQNVNQTTGPKFTNSRKNVSLKIKKVWSGITTANRPDSVSFEILRKTGENDYEPFGRTVTINKPAYDLSDTWTEVAEDLPAVDGNGNEYSYSVREVGSEGNHFESTVTAEADSVENGTAVKNVKVTNKPDSEKIVIPVRKNWAEGVSGNSVTVILLRDKQQVDSAVLKAGSDEESNWKHTFSNLPRFASDGHEYDYKVIEANDNYKADILADGNGGFIITNDQSDKKVSIPVEKKWADGVSGESATIILKQDDRKIGSIDLKESNSWKHTFKDLDKYAKDGHEYKYTVEETNNNYNTIIARNDVTDIEKGFTVRNYQSEEKVSIPVEKKWAEGVSGEEAVIVLVVNGEETDQKLVLTETDHWKGSFDNLDKYGKDGKEIEYSVTEETSEFQYTVEKDGNGGFIVTNYKEETPVTPPDDNPSSPNSPDSPDKGNGGSNSAVTVDSTAPLTGDNFDMSLFVLTAGGAALAIAITLAAARRRRRD